MEVTLLRSLCNPGDSSSVLQRSRTDRRICRHDSHGMHWFQRPRPGKLWWGWIALGAKCAVAAAPCVVLANIILTAEGMFKVPGALVNRGTFRAATLSVVHAGNHLSLAFDYASKSTTNWDGSANYGHKYFITKWEWATGPEERFSRMWITCHESSRSGSSREYSCKKFSTPLCGHDRFKLLSARCRPMPQPKVIAVEDTIAPRKGFVTGWQRGLFAAFKDLNHALSRSQKKL